VHGAHLVCGQRLTEQVDGGHLTAEHPLLVQLWGGSDVAFVEWLQPPTHALLAITQNFAHVGRRGWNLAEGILTRNSPFE